MMVMLEPARGSSDRGCVSLCHVVTYQILDHEGQLVRGCRCWHDDEAIPHPIADYQQAAERLHSSGLDNGAPDGCTTVQLGQRRALSTLSARASAHRQLGCLSKMAPVTRDCIRRVCHANMCGIMSRKGFTEKTPNLCKRFG